MKNIVFNSKTLVEATDQYATLSMQANVEYLHHIMKTKKFFAKPYPKYLLHIRIECELKII